MKKLVLVALALVGLAAQGQSYSSTICQNDRVNFGSYVGTAVEVFANGNVKIDLDGYSGYSMKQSRDLGRAVPCFMGICQNQRVNFGSYVGTAIEVFTNGQAKIDLDGYSGYSFKAIRDLGGEKRCVSHICANDRVNFGSYVGTAIEVFSNGSAKIDLDGYSGYSTKKVYQLGKAVQCLGALCTNSRVNFGSYTGTAIEVFDNGYVKIDLDGYSGYSFKSARDLGFEVQCVSQGPTLGTHCH